MIQEIPGYDNPDDAIMREDELMTDKTFIVYKDVPIDGFTDEQVGQLFRAMVDYSNGRDVNITDPEVKGLWRSEKQKLDKADENYKQTCENNRRAINLRWERERARKSRGELAGRVQDDEMITSSPAASKTQEKASDERKTTSPKKVKRKYGTYKHVQLTDEQYKKLVDEHGEEDVKACIQVVDDYCEQSGKTYKNYSIVMNKWGFRAVQEHREPRGDKKKNSFDFNESNHYDDDAIAKMMFKRSFE